MFDEIDADLNHFNHLHPSSASDLPSEYYLYDSFNSLYSNTNTGLTLIHFQP